jgi:cytochrome oxidase Cu insertion factor (SCO1/SenC/PrrC family)
MSRKTPVLLWSLVALIAAGMIYLSSPSRENPSEPKQPLTTGANSESSDLIVDEHGRAFAEVPWEYLRDVDRFKLKDQNGDEFDSADLNGEVYAVSFFFATCPSFCLDLNKQLDQTNSALRGTDIRFLTLTVDPKNDTTEKLRTYANQFGAEPDRWAFLNGQRHQLEQVGEHTFDVPIDPETHTDNIFLVDKWGRYRDRFKWDQPYDMKRFVEVAKELAAETEPPFGKVIKTRNVMAGTVPDSNKIPWVRDFHLTERSGKPFFSRQLTGEVWIANFFFTMCPGVCPRQSRYVRDLQKRLGQSSPKMVSISTDSQTDTPEVLREYATNLEADDDNWLFLTGDPNFIKRIGVEFFKANADGGHHSSLLFVVDRWGEVRGEFDWEKASEETEMLALVEKLRAETRPPRPVDPPKPKLIDDQDADELDEDE